MNYKKIALGALAYFISSFVIQGLLGFAFAGEYFLSISILRNPPIIYLAMSQTIVSGIGFAILYPITNFKGYPLSPYPDKNISAGKSDSCQKSEGQR